MRMSTHDRAKLGQVFTSPMLFSKLCLRRPLRRYQVAVAEAVARSVMSGAGETFAVMMSRQSGKNETAAHLEAMLLNLYRLRGGYIVKAAPTFRPQLVNSIQRLKAVLGGSWLTDYGPEEKYMMRVGFARAVFLSAAPGSAVVGATANILLEGDEAQDIDEDKWNKEFRPMGASTNVTTVLWGTAWTSQTLLAKTIGALDWLTQRDGIQRVFRVPWSVVADEVPAYGEYVRGEMDRLGPRHPLIRTQYLLEEIDGDGGLFPLATQALMRGSQPRQDRPTEGRAYAMLVDVGGAAEEQRAVQSERRQRDKTVCTIVECAEGQGPGRRTVYLVAQRFVWDGVPHETLFGALVTIAEQWDCSHVVVDATGIGAGLAGFLGGALGDRVIPFVFSSKSKSDLGWGFLGICNGGRFHDYANDGGEEYKEFWCQVMACQFEVIDGPGRLMRWGVPDRSLHDDLLLSAALCWRLDEEEVTPPVSSAVIENDDGWGR